MSIVLDETLHETLPGLVRSRSFDSITSIASSLSDLDTLPNSDIPEEEACVVTKNLTRTQSVNDNVCELTSKNITHETQDNRPVSAKTLRRLRRAMHNFHIGLLTHGETSRRVHRPSSSAHTDPDPSTDTAALESARSDPFESLDMPTTVHRPADAVWDLLLQ